jgi:L-fuconolactonase
VPVSAAAQPRSPGSRAIIDAHHHLWDLSVRAQPFLDSHPSLAPLRRTFAIAELAPLAAEAGVTATVAVQTVTDSAETQELLALAAAGPLIAAVVGWTDLTAPDLADAVGGLRAGAGGEHLAGIRHPLLTEPDPDWLARADVRRGLAALGESGLSFDLVLPPHLLPAAAAAAADAPGVTFVLDHLGNVEVAPVPDEAWSAAFTAFARLPNTVCKLSGILSEASDTAAAKPDVSALRPYFDLAMQCFGPDRLMFGSDWPVSMLGASYGDVVAAAHALTSELTEPERGVIFAGTARRVYQITTA